MGLVWLGQKDRQIMLEHETPVHEYGMVKIANKIQLNIVANCKAAYITTYVTGFVKINPNHTGTEIHFMCEH